MGENTKIEWARHTWNPWIGCTAVSPACDACYARDMMDFRYGRAKWGPGEERVRTSEQNWNQPLRWDRAAAKAGKPATVFCLSLGDIWDNEVDPVWRRDAFDVMRATPNLIYLLLSKRIGNAMKMAYAAGGLPSNAALGATMVNQAEWDRDIVKLKYAGKVLGAKFTFASVEPMLGPIGTRGIFPDWVIVGGESGREARPLHPAWPRGLRDQCSAAGVPFMVKQWGEWAPHKVIAGGNLGGDVRAGRVRIVHPSGRSGEEIMEETRLRQSEPGSRYMARVGKKAAGRLLDGVVHNDRPSVISHEAA